jgi:ABC-type nitrate/sulfonate/bicarbonate transport system substrate-binding protein
VSGSDFASPVLAYQEFLVAQGELAGPATIYQDNQSTIAMLQNGESKSDRTRHIKIRYFWTKERVDNGDLEIIYLPTEEMVADILTKPIQGDQFLHLRKLLLNLRV